MMEVKAQDILAEDWDTLIILDACRYDFFKKVYRDYLVGTLEKRASPGSCTGEWLVRTFPDRYDITYVSANPYINSYGVPLQKCNKKYNFSWRASDHFSRIIDAWEFGWDENLDTVPPGKVNETYFTNKPAKKTIIHYIQPHAPYLSLDSTIGSWRGNKEIIQGKELIQKRTLYLALRKWASQILENLIGRKGIWRVRKLLRREPSSVVEWLWREGNIERIHYYYEDNLRQVLSAAADLVKELNGKIIVTTDHGEAFGEQGVWGHPQKIRIPVLFEVPWLVISK